MDNFTIGGNSLGALSWDGRLGEWYTGYGLQGHWEDIQCDRFRNDIDVYLANASSHYKGIEVQPAAAGPHLSLWVLSGSSVWQDSHPRISAIALRQALTSARPSPPRTTEHRGA